MSDWDETVKKISSGLEGATNNMRKAATIFESSRWHLSRLPEILLLTIIYTLGACSILYLGFVCFQ